MCEMEPRFFDISLVRPASETAESIVTGTMVIFKRRRVFSNSCSLCINLYLQLYMELNQLLRFEAISRYIIANVTYIKRWCLKLLARGRYSNKKKNGTGRSSVSIVTKIQLGEENPQNKNPGPPGWILCEGLVTHVKHIPDGRWTCWSRKRSLVLPTTWRKLRYEIRNTTNNYSG
jgi:hypothetical protein